MNPAIRKVIENMEANGVSVRVEHIRRTRGEGDNKSTLPNGGVSRVRLRVPEQAVEVLGEAKCSHSDTFCRDTGANLAFKRAMECLTMELHRDTIVSLVAPPAPAGYP